VFVLVSEKLSELGRNFPHSIALICGDERLTYAELDHRANRFAAYLSQTGLAEGNTVAVCLQRSCDWIVAALGTMRARAAYVPLDSTWPDSRLRFAVRDSGATVLVARAALLSRLQVDALGVDPCRDACAIATAPAVPLAPVRPDSLAYVIYTSGSTGAPKGVEITHANLAHLVHWHRDTFDVTPQDRASHLAGLGFDAAGWEIWANLAAGATLCLADDATRLSPELLQQWLLRERVTLAFVPTIHATSLMDISWPTTTSLRFLLTGGDVLHCGPAADLPFSVVNNYGLTECTVVSTSAVLKPGCSGVPPIGRPITGTTVYLLDEAGHPVPDGSSGEIYIGGAGVGRGYRNLPGPTEQTFLSDPFAPTASARMYRTGDFGVRRPDGEIEFCGRRDRQTKIRGQRVELDEIDSALMAHPGVDFAVVVTSTSPAQENELVAHVRPRKNVPVPTPCELKQHLLLTLPDYMIPASFLRLHELPLSSSGKLDLKMLPPPLAASLQETSSARLPVTSIEETLLAMMRETLNNNSVRADNNFFLAGGHSLLAMQLVMRIRDAFGVDMTLRQLFEAPTVERLAFLVEATLIEKIGSTTDEEAEKQLAE
jgi:amino acid adenylation domain-containing protein